MNALDVDGVIALYRDRGDHRYGESITQLEHALQCAALARRDDASDDLTLAALLHDVGHLVVDLQTNDLEQLSNVDDDHEALGARILAPLFGSGVAQPVALHVTAKRWRCTREPAYYDQLSPASQATLEAQGGLLTTQECTRFEEHPGFREALWLRTWDDTGKVADLDVGSFDDWIPLLRSRASAR